METEPQKEKLLFICNMNVNRSVTGEHVYRKLGYPTASCGIRKMATRNVTREALAWADVIFVFEKCQRNYIRRFAYDLYLSKRIICLYLPDAFECNSPYLASLIRERVDMSLTAIREGREVNFPSFGGGPYCGNGMYY